VGEKPGEKLFAAAGKKVSEEMIKATWSPLVHGVQRAGDRGAGEASVGTMCREPLAEGLHSGNGRARIRLRADERELRARRGVRTLLPLTGQRILPAEGCITTTIKRSPAHAHNSRQHNAARFAARLPGPDGHKVRLRNRRVRRLHGAARWRAGELLPGVGRKSNGRKAADRGRLAPEGKLHPLQESFLDHDAAPTAGFCTPGMLMSARVCLDWKLRPTEGEIRSAISGQPLPLYGLPADC